MSNTPKLTLIIPAYNEAESLPQLLPQAILFCRDNQLRMIIVDDASADETPQILDAAAEQNDLLQVIHHKVNRGYGGAVISGIKACQTDYCVTMDADGQHRLVDILNLYRTQRKTNADLVIGSRSKDTRESSGFYRNMGKSIIRFVARVLVENMNISDLNSGMKLYDTALAQRYVKLCPEGMAFADVMTLTFLQQKHLIVEEPIQVLPRVKGKSTISTRTAFETVMEILNIVMVFNPLRIFFTFGISAVVVGVLWAIPFLLRGTGLSTASMLAITTGTILIMLGLIAEQLAQIRKKDL